MLLLLALIGCNPTPENVQSPEVPGAETLQAVQAMPRIETRMAAVSPAPARVRPVLDLPKGQAILGDCGGRMPQSRPRPSGARGAPGQVAPAPRPAPAPSPAPIPMNTPTAEPSTVLKAKPMERNGPADAPETGAEGDAVGGLLGPAAQPTGGLGTIGSGKGGGGTADGWGDGASVGDLKKQTPAKEVSPPEEVRRSRDSNKEAKNRESAVDATTETSGATRTVGGEMKPESEPMAVPPADRDALKHLGYRQPDDAAEVAGNAQEKRIETQKPVYDLADAEDLDEEEEAMELERPNQWLDWGATVHLSNDDSMSLASAQRLLWTTMQGRRPKMSEVRPHELLNYFSFDTVPVPEGQTFSVLGAADIEGETVTVALAVQGAIPERQPLDLTVVIDRSGSMAAEARMSYTKRGLNQMFGQLKNGDRIDLVYFESRVCTALEDYVVGRDDPALLEQAMASLRPMGSTDLNGGLQQAYKIQSSREGAASHGRNRRVMLITDAQMNSGTIDPGVVSQIGLELEDHNIRLTGVGVGRDFNDDVLDKLTEKGKGAYVYLGSEAVVDRVFGAGFDSLVRTLAHDVRFSLDLPPSLAMTRFYGEEASTTASDIQPINYFAGTSQVFLQDLTARNGDLVLTDPLVMRIEWRDAATGEPDALELRTTVGALLDGDRRNVHKARALMAWTDWAQSWAMSGKYAACSAAMDTYADRTALLADDAEVQYLSGLTSKVCGRTVAATPKVPVKVRVDSDIPIAEVRLDCGGHQWSDSIGGGDTVARFDNARSGSCRVILQGAVAMQAEVEVPSTGGDVRCTVRAGRVSCS